MWLITTSPSRPTATWAARSARPERPRCSKTSSNPDWPAPGRMLRRPLGTDLAPGLLALVGLLLQPSLNGLATVPHVTAHPIADRTVALVPPAIQGVKGDAQHFRNIRERHQLVTGLKCHHLF